MQHVVMQIMYCRGYAGEALSRESGGKISVCCSVTPKMSCILLVEVMHTVHLIGTPLGLGICILSFVERLSSFDLEVIYFWVVLC